MRCAVILILLMACCTRQRRPQVFELLPAAGSVESDKTASLSLDAIRITEADDLESATVLFKLRNRTTTSVYLRSPPWWQLWKNGAWEDAPDSSIGSSGALHQVDPGNERDIRYTAIRSRLGGASRIRLCITVYGEKEFPPKTSQRVCSNEFSWPSN